MGPVLDTKLGKDLFEVMLHCGSEELARHRQPLRSRDGQPHGNDECRKSSKD
jgi:hypothetical protein